MSYTPADAKPAAAVAYDGLVKMHAQELLRSDRFRRTGRMTPNEVHKVRLDLQQLRREKELDATVELILAKTDELDLEQSELNRDCGDAAVWDSPGVRR